MRSCWHGDPNKRPSFDTLFATLKELLPCAELQVNFQHFSEENRQIDWQFLDFWLIWFINQRALYNHALSIIIIGVICAHLLLAQE